MRSRLIAIVLTIAFTGAATAEPLGEGVSAYERGDFATALTLLRPMAEAGNAEALFYLAEMYRHGRGVP